MKLLSGCRTAQATRLPAMMEAFFQLLPLLMIPYHCQARPGAWVWGRVGDQPKAAAFRRSFPAVAASTDVVELTPASSQAVVILEDGRNVWGAVDVKTEVPAASEEYFETLFPASAAPLLSAAPDVIELTPASPPAAVTLEDGRYAWGALEVKTEVPAKSEEDFETLFPVSAASAAPLLLSASPDVIESTPASPPAVTLEDGRWSWGTV